MPEKTTEKSGLPVATKAKSLAEYNKLSLELSQARTLKERQVIADRAKKNSVHYTIENLLEWAFLWGELCCRAQFDCVHGDDFATERIQKDLKSKLKKAYGKLSREDFEEKIAFAKENNIVPTREWFMEKKWIGASGNDEYYTPFEVVQAARFAMNGIDLDPASNHIAQKVVEATKYYTKEDDGLSKEWSGRVFLNPPFSMLKAFSDKLINSLDSIDEAIFVCRMDLSNAWGRAVVRHCSMFCIPDKRIQFYGPDEKTVKSNNMANLILGFKTKETLFHFGFSDIGFVIHKKYAPPEDPEIRETLKQMGIAPY